MKPHRELQAQIHSEGNCQSLPIVNSISSVLRSTFEHICLWEERCQTLHNDINEAVNFLDTLHETYTKVSYKTNSLYRACEQLLADQTKLLNITECIENRLSYFDDVDRFSKVKSSFFDLSDHSFPSPESFHHSTGVRYQAANPNPNTYR